MIVTFVAHREAHRDDVEELVLQFDAQALKVLADIKDQLERAHMELVALEQRLVGAAVGIGEGREHMVRVVTMDHQEVDAEAGRGLAVHRVQHMCRKPTTCHESTPLGLKPGP